MQAVASLTDAQTLAWYIFARAQVGARAGMRLLEVFQTPEAVIAAPSRAWAAEARLSPAACARLLATINTPPADDLGRMARLGITLLPISHPDYPARLRTIPDPPCVLFVKGTLLAADAHAIGIVGSRRASPYGRHVAAELAAGLGERGFTVVSGMALGADAAAHEGALRAGGRTIAVLGCGVDVIYPPEHAELYERIAAMGAVVSENPPGAPPTKASFPARNRIISGLSLGVVVVEAPEKSGALITATHALEQGREVFAVPGSVNSVQSRGTHQLLRDGAKLVAGVEDILEELPAPPTPVVRRPAAAVNPVSGPSWEAYVAPGETPVPVMPVPAKPARKPRTAPPPVPEPPAVAAPAPMLPPEEAAVCGVLTAQAMPVDAIIAATGLSPAAVNAALLMLELKGLAQRRPGNLYIRL